MKKDHEVMQPSAWDATPSKNDQHGKVLVLMYHDIIPGRIPQVWVCNFLGHRWNIPTYQPFNPLHCDRCGLHI